MRAKTEMTKTGATKTETKSETKRPTGKRRTVPKPDRAATAARVYAAAERQIASIETILEKLDPTRVTESERTARMLASLARTLRDVADMDEETREATDDHEPCPRDLNELRSALLRRLEGLVAEQSAPVPSGR